MPPGEHVSFIIQPVIIEINQTLLLNHLQIVEIILT